MWNDTDHPLAYLITVRCRGTWLHGDERGSIDRRNNIFGMPRNHSNQAWEAYNRSSLATEPVYLDPKRRRSTETAIRETCELRNWLMLAVNVRTNHFHAMVDAGIIDPSKVLHALKANSTRQTRTDGCWPHAGSPWVDKGSKRWLWNDRSVDAAIYYVLHGQGAELPDFD